jgi:hypothetical protein
VIKPPSIQTDYTAFYSKDAAVIPAPDPLSEDATDEQKQAHDEQLKERTRLIQLARDTGDLSLIAQPGERITAFTMRPLTVEQFSELGAMHERGQTSIEIHALAFRFSVKSVSPLPDGVKLKTSEHPTMGKLASLSFLNDMKLPARMSAEIVSELGELAIERARDLSPKS